MNTTTATTNDFSHMFDFGFKVTPIAGTNGCYSAAGTGYRLYNSTTGQFVRWYSFATVAHTAMVAEAHTL